MAKTKVLYVEDEVFLARIVKESLESRDFQVHLVADGARAADVFTELQPDICVLDVMLPHKDGYAIAEEIRRQNPRVPIIFLTAKVQTQDLIKGFSSGGNDYLRKPFSMEELIIRINNLLQLCGGHHASDQSPRAEPPVRLGRFSFDPACYELHLGRQIRKLSHRENCLLQLLVQSRGRPVLRKDILMALWGDDSYANSRNLDVYISRIRDHLSADKNVQILTIKGVGYRLQSGDETA